MSVPLETLPTMPVMPAFAPAPVPAPQPSQPQSFDPNDIIEPPQVSASVQGEIPKAVYLARIMRATDTKSETSGDRMIHFACEIVAPDVVESQVEPGKQCQVAGRRFDMYAVLANTSKAFTGAYELLKKLMLIMPDGRISPALIVNTCNTGQVAFNVVLESERDVHRYPKQPGEKMGREMMYPGTQTPMLKGYRAKLPGEVDILQRCALPDGYVVPQF